MHLPIGYIIDRRYKVKRVLGQGGFGITYLTEDIELGRSVAVKELFLSGSSTRSSDQTVQSVSLAGMSFADFKAKFVREAQKLASIDHRNIVRVYDYFEANNTAYFSMAFVDGRSLKHLVNESGAMNDAVAVDVIRQLMDALEFLHNRSLLHRDIKPDNVMISNRWEVVLIDFGTARNIGVGHTVSTAATYSQGYSPLEQYGEQSTLDERSDIYALGATMYFLLTGNKPIDAPSRQTQDIRSPREINPTVSPSVSRAVMKAMALNAKDRYGFVSEFRRELAISDINSEESEPISSPPKPSLDFNMVFVEGGNLNVINGFPTFLSKITGKQSSSVTLSSFYIAKYPVTQAQWVEIMGANPSYFKDNDQAPVERVSWIDVQEFIRRLNLKTGKIFSLPTVFEWEYAAAGGAKSNGSKYAGSNDVHKVGWCVVNSKNRTYPVGQKAPNELGLYDMAGNVWEWCDDSELWTKPANSKKKRKVYKPIRGMSWYNGKLSFPPDRGLFSFEQNIRSSSCGFRLVQRSL